VNVLDRLAAAPRREHGQQEMKRLPKDALTPIGSWWQSVDFYDSAFFAWLALDGQSRITHSDRSRTSSGQSECVSESGRSSHRR
jgi:hypothetical protein